MSIGRTTATRRHRLRRLAGARHRELVCSIVIELTITAVAGERRSAANPDRGNSVAVSA